MLFRTITTFMNAAGRHQFNESLHQAIDLDDLLKKWTESETPYVRDNLTALEIYEDYVERNHFSPNLGKRMCRLIRFFGRPLILRYPPDGLPASV